jgi:hypothetical protein
MQPIICASLIGAAGAAGGIVNALLTDQGIFLPYRIKNIWCPGFLSNILIGAFSAFASWSFYGSGAGMNVQGDDKVRLTFSALAGALLVGVAGAKWLTNEVDKKLLTESVKALAKRQIPEARCLELCDQIDNASAREILMSVEEV